MLAQQIICIVRQHHKNVFVMIQHRKLSLVRSKQTPPQLIEDLCSWLRRKNILEISKLIII